MFLCLTRKNKVILDFINVMTKLKVKTIALWVNLKHNSHTVLQKGTHECTASTLGYFKNVSKGVGR